MIQWNQVSGGVLYCVVLITLMSFDHCNQWIWENRIWLVTVKTTQKSVIPNSTNIVVLLLQQHIQQKNKKQGSTNLNPLRAFWNSRCAILHLISTNSHRANRIKKHTAYQNCRNEMSWDIKWSSSGNTRGGHPEIEWLVLQKQSLLILWAETYWCENPDILGGKYYTVANVNCLIVFCGI